MVILRNKSWKGVQVSRSVQSVTSLSLLLPLPPCQVLASPTLPLIPFSLTPQVVEQSLRKSQQPRASQIKREIRARRNFSRHGFHPLKRSLTKPHGVVKPCLPSTGETLWGSQQVPLCRGELCFAVRVQICLCSCWIRLGLDSPDLLWGLDLSGPGSCPPVRGCCWLQEDLCSSSGC